MSINYKKTKDIVKNYHVRSTLSYAILKSGDIPYNTVNRHFKKIKEVFDVKTKEISRVAVIVTVVMVLSALAGCIPAVNVPNSTTTASQGGTTSAAGTTTEASKPRLNKIVYVDDTWADQPKMVEGFNKFVSEQLGYEFELRPIPTETYTEKINVMLLSGDAPDLLELPDNPYDFCQYYKNGFLAPLRKLVENSPKLKHINPDIFERYTYNGDWYGMPLQGYDLKVMYLRQDWLDNLGLEFPETTDELYTVLKAFTFDDPDKNGKNDTIGLTLPYYVHDQHPLFYAFDATYLFREDANGKIIDGFTQPQMMDALNYVKKLLDEGIFDNEWVTTTNSMQREKTTSGYAGAVCYWDDRYRWYNVETQKNFPEAIWVMLPYVKGPNGHYGVFEDGIGNPITISSKCKNIEQAFEYIEWRFGTEAGVWLDNHGVPADYVNDPAFAMEQKLLWEYNKGNPQPSEYTKESGNSLIGKPILLTAPIYKRPFDFGTEPYWADQAYFDIRPELEKAMVVQPYITMENDWYAGVAGLIKDKKDELITKYLFGDITQEQMYSEWDSWWNKINGPANLAKINESR